MKHLGDITKLDGHKLPIVDIITGGSPCQDLSVAGKRAGLAGERSGLFMEQIRIIKEMRDESRQLCMQGADEHIRPRYMVWENVPGAFSSNKGEDFRAVLEETAKVADKNAIIPRPDGGKWTPSGCIMGDGWSIAWRVHDAQFWGVPQRRKRIALVADFGGSSAPEILFERESLSGDIEKSAEQGQGTSESVERCVDTAIYDVRISSDGTKNWRAHCYTTDICRNLDTGGGRNQIATTEDQQSSKCLNSWDVQSKHIQPENGKAEALYSGECRGGGGESYVMQNTEVYGICSDNSNSMKSSNPYSGIYKAETTRTLDLNGGNPACNQGGMIVLEGNGSRDSHKGDGYKQSDTMYTLNTVEQHAICIGNGQVNDAISPKQSQEVSKALNAAATDSDNIPCVYGIDRASFNQGKNALYDFSVEEEKAQTLVARGPGGVLAKQLEPCVQEITKE